VVVGVAVAVGVTVGVGVGVGVGGEPPSVVKVLSLPNPVPALLVATIRK
jgi:hypothetical protein